MKAESKQIPQKLKLATTTTLKFVWHLSLFGISFFACLLTFYVWATHVTFRCMSLYSLFVWRLRDILIYTFCCLSSYSHDSTQQFSTSNIKLYRLSHVRAHCLSVTSTSFPLCSVYGGWIYIRNVKNFRPISVMPSCVLRIAERYSLLAIKQVINENKKGTVQLTEITWPNVARNQTPEKNGFLKYFMKTRLLAHQHRRSGRSVVTFSDSTPLLFQNFWILSRNFTNLRIRLLLRLQLRSMNQL